MMMQVAVVSLTTLHEHASGERMARMIWWGGGGRDTAQSHKRNVRRLMKNPAILEFSSREPETTFCGVAYLIPDKKSNSNSVTRQNTVSGCFGGCGEYSVTDFL